MSDLFLGELLVLVLLLPVLLRPFFRSLQGISGIPVLPLLALLSCFAIIAGSGFRLSFLPVFGFTILVFISGLAQLVRLIRGLPTDWYSPLFIVWNCILLLSFVVTLRFSWIVRPELSWLPGKQVVTSSFTEKVSAGVSAQYTVREPSSSASAVASRKVVILAGNGFIAGSARPTLAWILAGDGWTVVEATYQGVFDFKNILLSVPSLRAACVLGGTALSGKPCLSDEAEIELVAARNIERLVSFSHEKYGDTCRLYMVAEGPGAKALSSYIAAKPRALAGAAVFLPESGAASFSVSATIPVVHAAVSGMMPAASGTYPVLALSGDVSFLYGYGELCADDVLAAFLLGGVRDAGRKQAEIAGRRVSTWLAMRSAFNDVQ